MEGKITAMVKWVDAMFAGLESFGYALAWQFLGFFIADAISGGLLHSLILDPIGAASVPSGSIRFLVVGLWIGGAIASIGTYASIIKISIQTSQQLDFEEDRDRKTNNPSPERAT